VRPPLPDVKLPVTLVDHLKLSQTNPFLLMGPDAPDKGWIYRDFRAMPQAMWLELLDILGEGNFTIVSTLAQHQPPSPMCRAALWISPDAQFNWARYLKENVQ